ncbi:MAG: hypothetical protein JST60_16830, partial [Chloroflexi bacterium SZAS-1]|nr:hypothetical protein [Chloroflexi bacterium SZAS-1]
MNSTPHSVSARRALLALIMVLLLAGSLPEAISHPRALAQSTPQACSADPTKECEPNNTLGDATMVLLEPQTLTRTLTGTIDAVNDSQAKQGDWYKFIVQKGGASVSIQLANLPADYDMALFSNPLTSTLTVSDGVDLSNVSDTGAIDS